MLLTDQNEIRNMLAAVWVVILLFLRTSFFTDSTFLYVLLVDEYSQSLASSAEVTLLLNLEDHPAKANIIVYIQKV
jgi:hypothetical protein